MPATTLPRLLLLVACLNAVAATYAQSSREGPAVPPPPSPTQRETIETRPPADEFEPEVRITTKGTEIHEEYRYNGVLYRVKVIPRYGPPYYLVYDESGSFRRSDAEPKIIVPEWVIKRF